MPAPTNPSTAPGSAGSSHRRPFRYSSSDVRVSDAERSDVADALSRHYADGRLDQAEFNERVDRAMKAKTRADFRGLLDDLPDLADGPGSLGAEPPAMRYRRPRYPLHRILFFAFVVAVTVYVAHALMHSLVVWLLVALVVFLFLRDGPRGHGRF
jgi:Flp pilus assembly protein TadB